MKRKQIVMLKSPNHFRKEIGRLGPKKMRNVRKLLREFLRGLGSVLPKTTRMVRIACPGKNVSPCSTCALNPGTFRFKGFLPTSYGFLKALRDKKPFLCHTGQPWRDNVIDPATVMPCNAWLTLSSALPKETRRYAKGFSKLLEQIAAAK